MAEYKSAYTGQEIDSAIAKANTALQEELEPSFNASASKNITSQDITNWNNKANVSDIPTLISELTNDSNYQNLSQVQALINSAITTTLNGSY